MTTLLRHRWLVLAASLAALVAGCSGGGGGQAASSGAQTAASAPMSSPSPMASASPARFTTRIDNPWMPWVPGTRWVFRGRFGTERTVVTVTHHTKVVDGVRTVVVHDVVYRNGAVLEDTHDWYAQDRVGNVWYFGEDTKEFSGGHADPSGSWEAGVDGARAGIVMLAHPAPGDAYQQEHYKGKAEDQAQVVRVGASATVPYGHMSGLVVTRDFTRLEPSAAEHKYYAKGIGVVLEVGVHHGRNELVSKTGPA
jgi:hypothetical protein